MNLDKEKPQPLKIDESAPEKLEISLSDTNGKVFLKDIAIEKHFSTGSVGYYYGGKFTNPVSGERYKVSCNIALIGSKP